jgi:hypothetical protein
MGHLRIGMMRMPLFSGSVVMVMGSLGGHLVYGAAISAVYGTEVARPARRAAVA